MTLLGTLSQVTRELVSAQTAMWPKAVLSVGAVGPGRSMDSSAQRFSTDIHVYTQQRRQDSAGPAGAWASACLTSSQVLSLLPGQGQQP